MPIITETETSFSRFLPANEEQAQKEGPAFLDVVQSAFESENTVVNLAANGFELNKQFDPVADYNPFDKDIKGFELYADSFIDSRSPEQTQFIKNQVGHEIDNQMILKDGGVTAVVSQIAAGVTDPIYWPLMLVGVGQARLATSSSKAFAKAFGAGALAEIPAEIAKAQLQETRTLQQAALNVGGSAVLSGLLGVGLNKLKAGAPEVKVPDDLEAQLQNYVNDGPTELSMGAAQVQTLSKEDLDLIGLGGLENIPVSPLIRTQTSPEIRTQRIASAMMETPLVSKGAIKGIATAPEGGSVETRIKRWDFNLYEGLTAWTDSYKGYKKANKGKTLTKRDFRIEIGKAMRRGDQHQIPEVAEAAKNIRTKTFDALKDEAIAQKLLPEGIEVSTAQSYLTRIYNFDRITARRDEWNQVLDTWIGGIKGKAQRRVDELTAQGKKVPPGVKAEAGLTDIELRVTRDEITDNILGTSSGRTSYDVVQLERGPLKERVFNIPDERIEDFLESDIDIVMRQYVKTMAPDVELNRAFGDVTLKSNLEEINNAYAKKINAAKTEKERVKLQKRQEADVRDIAAMRDRLRGTYKTPADPNAFFVRAGRSLRDFNFMRMLGGMTISALPDAARLIAVNGLKPVAKGVAQLATSPKRFNMTRAEAKKAAVGLDMVLNSRASSLAELTDAYQRGSAFERGTRAASDTFSKLTLMSHWNSAMKQFSGVVTSDRILTESAKWAAGTISKTSIKRMAASGIDEAMAKRIAGQFTKHGDDGTLKLAQGDKWDDIAAMDTFRSAVLKEVDRTIVTPGAGEKPLWTSSETGKMIFQFKTFAAAAHHKVLLADLQYRDASALNGFLISVGIGGLVYGLKQTMAGRDISDNPNQIIVESMDKSGAFGYFWDANNMSAKLTNGEISVNKLAGADPVSRYASRNIIGALLGPSIGTVEDIRQVAGNISTGDFSDKDIRRVRKMLPGQNIFYMRQLLNSIEEEIAQ